MILDLFAACAVVLGAMTITRLAPGLVAVWKLVGEELAILLVLLLAIGCAISSIGWGLHHLALLSVQNTRHASAPLPSG